MINNLIHNSTGIYQRLTMLLLLGVSSASMANTMDKMACEANLAPIDKQLKPELISQSLKFLEGPTWSATQQAFYFSEMDPDGPQVNGPVSTIYRYTPQDGVSLFAKDTGSNGLLIDGNLLYLMDHKNRSLSAINLNQYSATKAPYQHIEPNILVGKYKDMQFNSPNDLALHSNGAIYFSDPDWQLNDREKQTPFTGVYQVGKAHKANLITDKLEKPNGIAISPNETKLYVGDVSGKITVFALDTAGNVGEVLTTLNVPSPDGMAFDCAGNLYATNYSDGEVIIFSPKGEVFHRLKFDTNITNVAFGGADGKTLLITGANRLYKLTTQIAGKGMYSQN